MSKKEAKCADCGWVYVDPAPKGMGIHRVPATCPKCGGHKIRIAPQVAKDDWDGGNYFDNFVDGKGR